MILFEYLNPVEISNLLANSTPKQKLCPHKFFSFHDVTIIKDDDTILAVVTADKEFAETIRHLKKGHCKINTTFTPAVRCNIINYQDFCSKILINELISRYGERV